MQEAGVFRHTGGPHLTRALGDELVILDVNSRIAHGLSAEAAAVWLACDGLSDAAAIARSTRIEPGRVTELLAQLAALDLLVGPAASDQPPVPERDSDRDPSPAGHTRRHALGQMVGVGVGLGLGIPAITSLVLPTPTEAFSSLGPPSGGTGQPPNPPPNPPTPLAGGSTQQPGGTPTQLPTTETKSIQRKRHRKKPKRHYVARHSTHPHKPTVGSPTSTAPGATAPDQIVTLRGSQLPFTG